MSYQHGVQVWEVATGTRRWAGRGQPTRIRRVAWSPDGAHLASHLFTLLATLLITLAGYD
ncbi:MAG: hypothetical protein E6I90_14740 [Chloroflexi bacterium]|nr:MAG: hypothetical protein E6I90_14740 [Chloroflexota bacterium]